jgi:hypothetical protein
MTPRRPTESACARHSTDALTNTMREGGATEHEIKVRD